MESLTHLLKAFGIEQPSTEYFKPKYRTAGGGWIIASPTILASAAPNTNYVPNLHGNETWEALEEARKLNFMDDGLYTDDILENMKSYRESSRSKEELAFKLSSQYHPQPEHHASGNLQGEVEPYELFNGIMPGISWISSLYHRFVDGFFWYGDVWSIIMSLFMTYQIVNSCCGVPMCNGGRIRV